MRKLSDMVWIEGRKAIRSRMPLWTALGSLFMPLGIAFLIFVARNPDISNKLGLVGAKADLIKYSATNWFEYLGFYGMLVAVGGFFLFSLVISWIFGREFADGTLKDMLAVPVERAAIILAKFIVAALWSGMLTLVIWIAGLATGALMRLPGGTPDVLIHGSLLMLVTAALVLLVSIPLAFLASAGRGYLLPICGAVLAIMAANVLALLGWGAYFPWGVPGMYVQDPTALPPISFWIVAFTALAGMAATHFWWKYADQNR